jgi:hypothetical protein
VSPWSLQIVTVSALADVEIAAKIATAINCVFISFSSRDCRDFREIVIAELALSVQKLAAQVVKLDLERGRRIAQRLFCLVRLDAGRSDPRHTWKFLYFL